MLRLLAHDFRSLDMGRKLATGPAAPGPRMAFTIHRQLCSVLLDERSKLSVWAYMCPVWGEQ
jgi:hypothetical protein